ncbi:MAG: hypothetical protein RLY93_15145 [Sumerlaeia bacterium]
MSDPLRQPPPLGHNEEKPLPPLVVLIPPLLVPSAIMWPLGWRLKRAGRRTVLFRYRSWARDIPENGRRLAIFLQGLEEDEIDAVAFSLGAILLRWATNHHDIPRLRRVVMIGPPNRGAHMADWLSRRLGPLYSLIWGRAALQLRRGGRGLAERAGQLDPGTDLGVIAGGTGKGRGYNPLIPGDNDMTVAVAETILPGMLDFTVLRRPHNMLPISARTADLAIRFLESGKFKTRQKTP